MNIAVCPPTWTGAPMPATTGGNTVVAEPVDELRRRFVLRPGRRSHLDHRDVAARTDDRGGSTCGDAGSACTALEIAASAAPSFVVAERSTASISGPLKPGPKPSARGRSCGAASSSSGSGSHRSARGAWLNSGRGEHE